MSPQNNWECAGAWTRHTCMSATFVMSCFWVKMKNRGVALCVWRLGAFAGRTFISMEECKHLSENVNDPDFWQTPSTQSQTQKNQSSVVLLWGYSVLSEPGAFVALRYHIQHCFNRIPTSKAAVPRLWPLRQVTADTEPLPIAPVSTFTWRNKKYLL